MSYDTRALMHQNNSYPVSLEAERKERRKKPLLNRPSKDTLPSDLLPLLTLPLPPLNNHFNNLQRN